MIIMESTKRRNAIGATRLSRQWTFAVGLAFVSCLAMLHLCIPMYYSPLEDHSPNELRLHFQAGLPISLQSYAQIYRNGYLVRPSDDETNLRHMDMQDVTPTPERRYTDKPRIVFLAPEQPHQLPATARSVTPMLTVHRSKHKSKDPARYIHPYERPFYDDCTPMADWQRTHHPTCNLVHALPPNDMALLSTRGSWRTVWKVASNADTTVLKMLNFPQRDFDQESFVHHQTDARMMEQLTWSPFVVDIFSFCGQSVMTEWAPRDGRSLIKDKSLTYRDRLKLARDLARGLDHIHSLDYKYGTNATFAHNDINMANIVNTHGSVIKYNDFNIGAMLRWNQSKPCGYPVRFDGKLWRSPEEIRNTTYVSEKTDLYALGNVLFQVLTKHQPWTWLEPEGQLELTEVARKKLAGDMPHIPVKYKRNALSYQGLYFGTLACYRLDPTERPTAFQLANAFRTVLKWYDEQRANLTLWDVATLFRVER
jgi:hypothetical protein